MYEKLYGFLEPKWEKYSFAISFLVSILVGVLYFWGWINNIRSVTGNVVTFASIVIGVNGVFLTLVITLQESPAFQRLKDIFPPFQAKLYTCLRDQIITGLVVVLISIIINFLPPSPSPYLSIFGVCIWFYFFVQMFVGSIMSVKLVTDIIIKNFNIPTRSKMK
ncbi:hypothetical protein [Psychrobacillus sp. L4]|uniref:hypothetical protein n=1 Tax=Psychrobacillus sp. L4 TaxID=3236892 RepID=UPI0036F1D54E